MERAWIELEGIEAIVKTASKEKFFIEFYSSCLEGMEFLSNEMLNNSCGNVAQRRTFISVSFRDTPLE